MPLLHFYPRRMVTKTGFILEAIIFDLSQENAQKITNKKAGKNAQEMNRTREKMSAK